MQQLLDVTDRHGRLFQNGSIIGGALLAAGGVWLLASGVSPLVGGAAIVVGLVMTVVGVRVKQRWEVEYRGHRIRFENAPTSGEKLFVDERLVARGGLGVRMELKATIDHGEAAGDELIAQVEAGLLTFKLKLFALPAAN